ncbi:hypothetical protein CDAR_388641 [Caerostris darwini]|uniref:Uncharacterized protein n=1 Tax=Caerostris darwini TaxID=1538125 RepID=A0AAV4S5D0_9ARAC|nr:hypothetical protein CDAR_388641 [Caerostris darwini]
MDWCRGEFLSAPELLPFLEYVVDIWLQNGGGAYVEIIRLLSVARLVKSMQRLLLFVGGCFQVKFFVAFRRRRDGSFEPCRLAVHVYLTALFME